MNHLAQYLLRFFLPWACAGCRAALEGLEDDGFCGRCWLSIPRIQGMVCQSCGIPLKDGGNLCYSCRLGPPPLMIRAAAEYQGVIRPAIHRFKYTGRRTLERSFGALLRYAWTHYAELQDVQGLVPVPLYRNNERIRGYNQAELLAHQLSNETGLPTFGALIRARATHSQYELNRTERSKNVRSAFALHPYLISKTDIFKDRSFLLIDDICTTSSTLGECARVLYHSGARSVKALVLARDL